jgi:predicted DNA-binding transcriptional regulator YafY
MKNPKEEYGERDFILYERTPEIKGLHHFELLAKAIEDRQVLRLTYLPFYEDKPYFNEVHPYLLREFSYRWYLVGWNAFKNQLRTYALDRIRAVDVLDDLAYRHADFSAAAYFKYSIGIIAPSGAPALVKLAVQRNQAQYLITRPWHHSQNIQEESEDEVVFSFRLHPTYEFKSLILGLGKDARVLEPDSLRDEMRGELEQMLKAYG